MSQATDLKMSLSAGSDQPNAGGTGSAFQSPLAR